SGAILCGHIHRTYQLDLEGLDCDLYCAGSATMEDHEGFWVYEVAGKEMKAKRVVWDKEHACYSYQK
ncbi:MAG: metallophosphoesterase, partial [Sulfurovum sp.]|nr:metallophosphoesterase [Sulfurovum sp.]